jgi:hypothetical protein
MFSEQTIPIPGTDDRDNENQEEDRRPPIAGRRDAAMASRSHAFAKCAFKNA